MENLPIKEQSRAGEGDDDQRAKLAAARKLQRNGEQVGHSPFLAALVPIFLLENLPCRGVIAHFLDNLLHIQ